jgi:hypothetical protein
MCSFKQKTGIRFQRLPIFWIPLTPKHEEKETRRTSAIYETAMAHQRHTEQTVLTRKEKPTPANTGAPIPGYRKRGPITPINDRSTSARHTKEQHSNSSNYRGKGPTYSSEA